MVTDTELNSLESAYNQALSGYNRAQDKLKSIEDEITSTVLASEKTFASYIASTDPVVKKQLYQTYQDQQSQVKKTQESKALYATQVVGQAQVKLKSAETAFKVARSQLVNQVSAAKALSNESKSGMIPVRSGSGDTQSLASNTTATQYAQANISQNNSALLDSNITLTYTRKAQISKAQLNAADKTYTTESNKLSDFWSVKDTESVSYAIQKAATLEAQRKWELARDGLEEVTIQDKLLSRDNQDPFAGSLTDPQIKIDLDGSGADYSVLGESTDNQEILVNGHKMIDQRVRLRPKETSGSTYPFFGNEGSVLYRLNETNGVFFPYTPVITMAHKANYSQVSPTHANTDYHVYNNSPAVQIQISGQFTAQNDAEALYTLAALHFFRSATKMSFGENDPNAGLPPAPLVLSGYGEFMFNDLTVLLSDFSMDLPNGVDYRQVEISGHTAWVPVLTTFNVTCVVQQTPRQQREDFTLSDFTSGALFSAGSNKGWI